MRVGQRMHARETGGRTLACSGDKATQNVTGCDSPEVPWAGHPVSNGPHQPQEGLEGLSEKPPEAIQRKKDLEESKERREDQGARANRTTEHLPEEPRECSKHCTSYGNGTGMPQQASAIIEPQVITRSYPVS